MHWLFIVGAILLALGLVMFLPNVSGRIPRPDPEEFMREGYRAGDRSLDELKYRSAVKDWEADASQHRGARVIGWFLVISALVIMAGLTFRITPTNKISMINSFGTTVGVADNGLTPMAPWSKTVKFDAARQYLRFGGEGNDESPSSDQKTWPCIPVKMDKEAGNCVSVTVAWQMRASTLKEQEQAKALYRSFRTFDRLTENFAAANARGAAQQTYDRVNPLIPESNPSLAMLSEEFRKQLEQLVKGEIEIVSVQITGFDYDPKTDEAIANMQAEYAKTTLAEQQKLTNEAISRANAALITSLNDLILKDACVKGNVANGQNAGPCLQPGWASVPSPDKAPAK